MTKKDYTIKPTAKQRRYLKNLMENGGNRRKAAIDAGYSQAIADNPKKIEETKGWQQLLDFYLPDDFLLNVHKRNIKQSKDKGASDKALDMAYKLKRKYPRDEGELDVGDVRIIVKSN